MTRGPKPKGDAPVQYLASKFTHHSLSCQHCNDNRSVVLDSKEIADGSEIRRRRMCINRHRFTTWERIGKVFTVKPSAESCERSEEWST